MNVVCGKNNRKICWGHQLRAKIKKSVLPYISQRQFHFSDVTGVVAPSGMGDFTFDVTRPSALRIKGELCGQIKNIPYDLHGLKTKRFSHNYQ